MTKQNTASSVSQEAGLLSKKSLLYFYINTGITLLAGNMFNYSLIIYSFDITRSQTFSGSVFLANVLPTVLFSFFVGAFLDRYSRIKILYIFQTNFIISGIVLGTLIYFGKMNYDIRYILILLSSYNGLALTFIIPGRLTLLGNLTHSKDTAKATIMLNILIIIGFGLAPMIAGLIKQKYHWDVLFFTIAFLYFSGYLFLISVKVPETAIPEKETIWAGLKKGMSFIKSEKLAFELLLMTSLAVFMVGPLQVVLPQFAKKTLLLDEQGRGLYMGTLGFGLLLGGVGARLLHDRFHRGYIMLGVLILTGILVFVLSNIQASFVSGVILLCIGVMGGLLTALIPSVLQIITPDSVRGRVMSFYSLIFQSTPALSGLLTGKLADVYGQSYSIAVSGITIIVLGVLSFVAFARLRELR
ncbi:MFS transporter [Leptospira gomenensis]|uniref:MFS transporter n=1 Tax=Leptospira gomenensis TaxID=2484974 RepID=A0A5F1YBE9_9LEPT|nr:MFS transporter [Leptospira gomenensis]TGK33418.1 MFS transporter [Leptospira gomenensis]TGK40940.1 MFS transporter [Leptospira gomenensis]TGK46390.1 MFS transporter [Leptospira gomenensis]TGK67474.1 MFS transporter [Leptospira gomenensis]